MRDVCEPATNSAGVTKGAHAAILATWAVVIADQQRTDTIGASAFFRHPSADHKFLTESHFDLAPHGRAPARLIGTGQHLGDDSFHSAAAGGLQHRLALANVVWRDLP